jgi:hypothetical protein
LSKRSTTPDVPPSAFERKIPKSEEVPLLHSPVFWVALAIVGAIGAGLYYWENRSAWETLPAQPPPPGPTPEAKVAEPAPEASAEPQIQHPIPAAETVAAEEPKALPPLDESDEVVQQSLTRAFGKQSLTGISLSEELIRHLVATVDGLPRQHVPTHLFPLRPPPGRLATSGKDDTLILSPDNYARYARFVKLAQTLETKKLVAVYVRFYPLLQQAYAELGYPKRYFNDRLVEVIDHLLAAPDVQGPVELVRFGPYYEFADPELEALSAGRKLLVRMGPENAAVIKSKLRELRRQISTVPPT